MNTVLNNKRLSMVELNSVSSSDSKLSTQTLMSKIGAPRSIQTENFDVFSNTDDIDSPVSSAASGINSINDT